MEELDKSSANQSSVPRLWTKGFIALLTTQFLVALNDNIFRWLIIPIGKWAIGWTDKTDQIRMIGSLAFVLPFMFLASYAGYVCDKYNRRKVIIWCKIAELVVMLIGTVAILSKSVPFMLITLFLMASQSTFFSPAKYGSMPNLVNEKRISEANGFIAMTTMIACIAGTGIGGLLFALTTLNHEEPVPGSGGMYMWWIWAGTIIGIATLGLLASLFIPSIPAADPKAKFPVNPFTQTCKDLFFLFKNKFIFWIAMASSFFWGFGALAQINIDKFATEYLSVSQEYVSFLLMALSCGLALGALLAGRISRGKIELKLVPVGALFIVVFCSLLFFTPHVVIPEGEEVASIGTSGFKFAVSMLFLLGLSAGLYDVPLLAALQTKSPEEHRCRILAAYNFCSFAAMALCSIAQGLLADPKTLDLSSTQIWLACGILSLPVLYYTAKYFCFPPRKTPVGED